jgi:DNA-binding transcriptional regulator LsrR (DeoR family)
MNIPINSRESDEQILTVLDMFNNQHMTGPQIAKALGISRGKIAGMRDRVAKAESKSDPLYANQDGTMPAKWWAA